MKTIVATNWAFAALRSDGRVVTWGSSRYGGDSTSVKNELRDVKTIVASRGAFVALRSDSTVVTWGCSECGGDCTLVREELRDIVRVECAGHFHFTAWAADGQSVTWPRVHDHRV